MSNVFSVDDPPETFNTDLESLEFELKEIKICKGYKLGKNELDYLPPAAALQKRVEPIYETLPGWNESTVGARSWVDLPPNAIKYVRRIEELVDCPLALVSTSPEREDTILVKDPFEN